MIITSSIVADSMLLLTILFGIAISFGMMIDRVCYLRRKKRQQHQDRLIGQALAEAIRLDYQGVKPPKGPEGPKDPEGVQGPAGYNA